LTDNRASFSEQLVERKTNRQPWRCSRIISRDQTARSDAAVKNAEAREVSAIGLDSDRDRSHARNAGSVELYRNADKTSLGVV